MSRLCRLTVLFLSLASVLAYAVPRVTSVEPDAVEPGGSAVANGSDLQRGSVAKLYLTAGGKDIEVKIPEQSSEMIKFELPDSAAMMRYRLMVLTGGPGAAYMEQPVSLEVVDADTAKMRAEEEEVELEIIEAEPLEEEEEPTKGKKRRKKKK